MAGKCLVMDKSMDKGIGTDTNDKDNKTAALTAWQHMQSNDTVTLKDEKEIDCDLMIKRVKYDRIKSRLRGYGLHSNCTIFAILKRELIHFLMPSLYGIHEIAFTGKQINILNGLTPIGGTLTDSLNVSLKKLMYLLKSLLMKPNKIGSHLIRCIFYCFSLNHTIKELPIVINDIKLFEAIKILVVNQ